MFDELDNQNAMSGSDAQPTGVPRPDLVAKTLPPKTEDIFSEVDKIVKPEVLRPKENNSSPTIGTVIPPDDSWLKNKGLIAGFILVGLVILIGGGYFGYRLMNRDAAAVNNEIKEEINNNQIAPEVPVTPEIPEPVENNNVINQPIQPEVIQPVDSDQDGLSDEEEVGLGINPNDPDTDHDGLTDREEVKVYLTDPLKADTDGDGFNDGEEIKNNFNPNGQGKLYEIKE